MRNNDGVIWGRFGSSGERVMTKDGLWFFNSREGEKGPYLSQREVERALTSYVELMDLLDRARTKSN